MMTQKTITSPIGSLTITADSDAIISVQFGQSTPLRSGGSSTSASTNKGLLSQCIRELNEYFSGKRTSFTVPLKPQGTKFQLRVWRRIGKVPFGKTKSYGALAEAIGSPKTVRAVGSACGKNPLQILIPCHRVVASQSLGGYSGGLKGKKWLLEHEQSRQNH